MSDTQYDYLDNVIVDLNRKLEKARSALRDIADRDFRDHHDWQRMANWCVGRAQAALEEIGRV